MLSGMELPQLDLLAAGTKETFEAMGKVGALRTVIKSVTTTMKKLC